MFRFMVLKVEELDRWEALSTLPVTPGHPDWDPADEWTTMQVAMVEAESLQKKAARVGLMSLQLKHWKALYVQLHITRKEVKARLAKRIMQMLYKTLFRGWRGHYSAPKWYYSNAFHR